MSTDTSPTPPQASRLRGLAGGLERSGFTVDGVADCVGDLAARALHREQRLPADLVTAAQDSPVATLVRLFALGLPVPAERLERAVSGWPVQRWAQAGLVRVERGRARALFDLRPYADDHGDWWVVCDLSEMMTGAPLRSEHVLGIGGASLTLAGWTPRRAVRRALDLGTGCGVQSLHLSRHAEQVVATDTSRRALAIAAANAELNGLDWHLRAGDLFEPVAQERFDLVVSNPPFVITPRVAGLPEYEYRDGGRVGHQVVAEVVQQVQHHLRPGGVAQLLGNWEVPTGGDWAAVVGSWLSESGLDAWVIERDQQDPAEYAELWAGDGGHRGGVEFERMYASWLTDFASRDVERIGFGVITVQRPDSAREPFRDYTQARGPVTGPMGPCIDAGLRARTWLAEQGERGVLQRAWRCAADVTDERFARPGAADPSVIQFRQGGGLGRTVRADTVLAGFLSVADGDVSAGAALEAIAELIGASADAVRSQALPAIRELIADGLLI